MEENNFRRWTGQLDNSVVTRLRKGRLSYRLHVVPDRPNIEGLGEREGERERGGEREREKEREREGEREGGRGRERGRERDREREGGIERGREERE